jgi:glutathione-regulated potassium-efflux system ancillary protein KefC
MMRGFSRKIATQPQYSFLIAAVIASAVVWALMAGLFFFPCHLLPMRQQPREPLPAEDELNEEG